MSAETLLLIFGFFFKISPNPQECDERRQRRILAGSSYYRGPDTPPSTIRFFDARQGKNVFLKT
jgi:hypothetical protein